MQLVLHRHQEKLIRSDKRFLAAIAGIRGGKTTIGAIWLLQEIDRLREAGSYGDFIIGAPTSKIMEQSTLPKFKEFFPADWGTYKEGKGFFELGWSREGTEEPCRIFCRSLDEPNSIEGIEAHAIWFDEVGMMKSDAWTNAQGRLSVTQGRAILTTTPYNVGWLFRDIYKRQEDKDYEVVSWSSNENPAFPQEEFERAKRTLPKAIFERRYMGKFTRLEGLVYPEFDEEFHVVDPFDIPPGWLRFAGMDFGRNNPNAIIYIAEDPDSHQYYAYKEFYRNETLLKVLSDNLSSEPLVSYVLADHASAQLIAELKQYYGHGNIKEADKNIDVGIARIAGLIQEGRLKIFKGRCNNLVDEILDYHYAPPNLDKPQSEKPVAKNNHALDALRYAFSRPLQGLYVARPKKLLRRSASRMMALRVDEDSWTGY